MGQIEFGEFMQLDGLAIKFKFVTGNDWSLAGGEKSGAGQHSFKDSLTKNSSNKMVWNLPFEVTFRSMTPHGWPQLVLYCTSTDSDGNEFVRAYGCTHLPIAPGVTKKAVRMFTPLAQNKCLEFFGVFNDGKGMVIDNPELIAKG